VKFSGLLQPACQTITELTSQIISLMESAPAKRQNFLLLPARTPGTRSIKT
jgi:hypothetical protein